MRSKATFPLILALLYLSREKKMHGGSRFKPIRTAAGNPRAKLAPFGIALSPYPEDLEGWASWEITCRAGNTCRPEIGNTFPNARSQEESIQ